MCVADPACNQWVRQRFQILTSGRLAGPTSVIVFGFGPIWRPTVVLVFGFGPSAMI